MILVWDVYVWFQFDALHIAYQTSSCCNYHHHHFNIHFLLKLIKGNRRLLPKQHKVDNQPLPFSLKAVVYLWEYWNKVLVTGCSSRHQPARIKEETLESGNLVSSSWIQPYHTAMYEKIKKYLLELFQSCVSSKKCELTSRYYCQLTTGGLPTSHTLGCALVCTGVERAHVIDRQGRSTRVDRYPRIISRNISTWEKPFTRNCLISLSNMN